VKKIAFFDFDGTITTRDTFLEFIRFTRGMVPFYTGFLLKAPWIIAYKLGMVAPQVAKEQVLRFFFSGTDARLFESYCESFARRRLPALVRPAALQEILRLKREGTQVVIVSASPENWIRKWTATIGVQLIASRLEVAGGKITGKLTGKNCRDEEKVARIREHYTLSDYSEIYAYGDTRGDLPMLKMATKPHYKPFRRQA